MNRRIRQNFRFIVWRLQAGRYFRRACGQTRQDTRKTRKIFLEAFAAAFPVTDIAERRILFRKHVLLYSFASVSIILATGGGAIVFADQANVSATHPLYGLKRASENIRLALSSSQKKTELESAFAQRRLDEIQKIQTNAVSENAARAALVKKLDVDFENHIDAALERLDDSSTGPAQTAQGVICKNIEQVLQRHAQIAPDKSDLPQDLARLKNKCKNPQGRSEGSN